LGAALLWFLLAKKRKNEKAKRDLAQVGHALDGYHPTNPMGQDPIEKYSHTVSLQPSELLGDLHLGQYQAGNQGQYPAEVPGSAPEPARTELCLENCRSPF
jgi:hypothetical protein